MKTINKKITKLTVTAGLFAVALVQSMTAQADVTTITFDRLATTWETGPVQNVTDSGYTVETNGLPFYVHSEETNQYISTYKGSEALVMYKNDAGLFDLQSFDYAYRRLGTEHPAQVNVTGYVQDGSVVTASFLFDDINHNPFRTAILPDTFRNLSSIQFVSDISAGVGGYDLDTIVVNGLTTENIHPTVCEQTYPVISLVTTGGGQSAAVDGQVQAKFTGQITTESGLTSGGKNTVTICPGTRVDYDVTSTLGTAVCTLNGETIQTTGRLGDGQQIICSNKPDGSDTDRFTIQGGM